MTAKTITQLTALAAADAASADVLPIVDVSDTTMAATGTTKKITLTDLQSAAVSAGTANGVMYLNGSKVATSGSALTFDGSVLNIAGSVRAQTSLLVYGSGDRLNVFPQVAGSGVQLLATNNANSAYAPLTLDGSATIFNASGSEQMRLTSTGLGIGTSSPAAKLSISGGSVSIAGSTAGSGTLKLGDPTDPIPYVGVYRSAAASINSNGNYLNLGGYDGIAFTSGPFALSAQAERMRLDANGNLGLGVATAPATTDSGVLFIKGGSELVFTTDYANYTANAYWASGSWRYITAAPATWIQHSGGSYRWHTAPSGTAGNAISFTQAMTLDASGNLNIGQTSAGTINANGLSLFVSLGAIAYNHLSGTSSGTVYANFGYAGTAIGSITQSGTTAVAYNTSSDYRLKNITGPITTSGAYIDSLNPVEGTWKADGSTFVGLIAHEVQEVSRTQVATGEKDGEQMQAMDYSNSELIANLIAEVQALRKRVAQLEAR